MSSPRDTSVAIDKTLAAYSADVRLTKREALDCAKLMQAAWP